MVDFGFDIRPIFSQPIVRVTSNLLPHTFSGDRRQALDTSSKISQIIDRFGELSAVSQKLTKPVTTAQRLRMSENQTIYLLADCNSGKNGQVLGLLKVGTKTLYLFDENGETRKIDNAPCILDFYIHDTHQRFGLGKQLFETMLNHEHWLPINCTIDRPSDKLLAFFKKHYGLSQTIPQVNNFVLYEGFFNKDNIKPNNTLEKTNGVYNTDSPNSQLFGSYYVNNDKNKKSERKPDGQSLFNQQITQISPSGRYGARRPVCSMAEKTQSDVSLTPSQAAEQAKLNARKNPLDALSRSSIRQSAFERRSGLQDVDEEYLKLNVFSRPNSNRHSGLGDPQAVISGQQQADTQSLSNASMKGQPQGNPQGGQIPQQGQVQAAGQTQQAQPQQGQGQGQGQQQQVNVVHNQAQNQSANVGQGQGQIPAQSQPQIIQGADTVKEGGTGLYSPSIQSEHFQMKREVATNRSVSPGPQHGVEDENKPINTEGDIIEMDNVDAQVEAQIEEEQLDNSKPPSVDIYVDEILETKTRKKFHLSKQHTGLKNLSSGVGTALCASIDNNPCHPVAKIGPPHSADNTNNPVDATNVGLTDRGYCDLKFHHNKLW